MSQLPLFGHLAGRESDTPTSVGLGPIPPADPDLAELAAQLPPTLRFGCCSWTFRGWEQVYRREYSSDKMFHRHALVEYAAFPMFRSVEIDSTYYAPPEVQALRSYAHDIREGVPGAPVGDSAAASQIEPPDFNCALKVWSELTTVVFPRHRRFGARAGMRNPHFLDPSRFADTFVGPIEDANFGPLGPLIVEIPPIPRGAIDTHLIATALARFLAQAPSGYRYAIEVRNPELLTERHFAILRDYGAAHVYTFHARMPPIAEQLKRCTVTEAPLAVCRLMLPPGASYQEQKDRFKPFSTIQEPQRAMRSDVVRLIREASMAEIPTYVYCNNKAEGCSPATAIAIARQLISDDD